MPIEFDSPGWLLLVPALFITYLISHNYFLRNQSVHQDMVSVYLPLGLNQINYLEKRINKNSFGYVNWLMITILSIALANPVIKTKIPVPPEETRDIFFIIDTSVGMSIKDYAINENELDRLNLVKALLIEFIGQLNNSRTGTMVYADQAYILTPLTNDKKLARSNIKRIRTAVAGRRNNLTHALNTYLKYKKTISANPSVIVLSQGSNLENSGSLNTIISRYNQQNIKLHFIGLGAESHGDKTTSKLIYDPIDRKLLSDLASTTGGDFFWAGNDHRLESTLLKIKASETETVLAEDIYRTEYYYRWPLYLFLCLLLSRQAFVFFRRYRR